MDVEKCVLASIISPGQYLLLSHQEHSSEIKHVEELLTKEINCWEGKKDEICLLPEMNVAVKLLEEDEFFRRGCIKSKVNKNVYEVFLIDYGKVVELDKSKIWIIKNNTFNAFEPLSFGFTLHGLIPTEFCLVNGSKKQRICKDWTIESKEFVEELFKTRKEIFIKNILIYGNTIYGDIFIVQENHSKVSLRKLLVKHKFCVYSENYFLRNVFEISNPVKLKAEYDKCSKVTLKFSDNGTESIMNEETIKKCFINSSSSFHSESKSELKKSFGNSEKSNSKKPVGQQSKSPSNDVPLINERQKKNNKHERLNISGAPGGISKKNQPFEIYIGRGKKLILPSNAVYEENAYVNFKLKTYGNASENPWLPKDKTTENVTHDNMEFSKSNEIENKGRIFLKTDRCAEKTVSMFSHKPVVRALKNLKNSRNSVNFDSQNSKTFECVPEISNQIDFPNPKQNSELNDLLLINNPMFRKEFLSSEIPVTKEIEIKNSKKNLRSEFSPHLNDYSEPFVLCKDSAVEPVKNFKDLSIGTNILQNWSECSHFKDLSPLQRWTIPAICSGQDVVVIGSLKTSKTLSYLIPLLDFIQKKSFEELPEGNGPLAVIVCSSSCVGEFIYSLCNDLLGNVSGCSRTNGKISVILAHGSGSEEQIWVNLTNGCHVLISTPHCLVRLLEMPVITNFDRLSCLILDEIDIISLDPFKCNMQVILEEAQFRTKNRFCQKIFCGEKWTPEVERLVKLHLKSYTLIISSYLEAAVCARLKPKIYLVDQNHKAEILLDKIKDKIGENKILIVCENTPDAAFISNYLNGKGVDSVVAHEDTEVDEIKEIQKIWNVSKPIPIVVAIDDVIGELKIKNADILVHYSLTSKSKTNFFFRYSTILNNCFSYGRDSQGLQRNVKSSDIILVDEDDHYQLPQITDFVLRLGGNVSARLLEKCDEIQKKIEISKKSPICKNLLNMGFCRKSKDCSQRHAFIKSLDSPHQHFSNGWVSFLIVKVHDACSFSVKLLEHTDASGKKSKFDHDLAIPEKLKKFYQLKQNRKVHGPPKIGDKCVVKSYSSNQEIFRRAEIVEFLRMDKHNQPEKVKVRLIDEGEYVQLKNMNLYELPNELAGVPPLTIEVKLVGIQPLDFDINWNGVATNFTKQLMTQKLEKEQCWLGKIVLALRNLLFLDPIMLKRFLPNLKTHVFDFVVGEELLNSRLAIRNDDHLPNLMKLCEEGGIEIPKEKGNKKEASMVQPQWAFFEKDLVRVNFSAAESPSTVFLQVKKFENLLADLERACQVEAERIKESYRREKEKISNLSVGMFCLAKQFEERWNRGRVESVNETDFYIYFVDHGDFHVVDKSNVMPISQNLLLRLPCQAIECSLIGIGEAKESKAKLLDEIYNFSDECKNDLYACVIDKNLRAEVTGGRKYSLNLLNLKGESLNKYLIDKGKAIAVESERKFLEDQPVAASQEENEDENEEQNDKYSVLEEPKRNSEKNSKNALPEANAETNLGKYFSQMSNDLFENESELLFLKKFASEIFGSVPVNSAKSLGNEKTISIHSRSKNDSSSQREITSCRGNAEIESQNSGIASKINYKRLLSVHRKREGRISRRPELKIRGDFLTPWVLWCQNQSEVQLKIMLNNVEKYRCDCTVTNLSFRCVLGEKFYAVDLKLFGSISPQLTEITLKTFHVVIRLKKLCFLLWPRLHRDEGKHRWISLDVDGFREEKNLFSDPIELAKRNMAEGILKEGTRMKVIDSYSDSDDSGRDDGDELEFSDHED